MSNMLPLSLDRLAEHITAKQDEYLQLEPCGYMLDWFAQQYYLCWQQTNTDASLELWGHMGGQLATEWVRQYSEVRITATDDEDICKADYLSDIYIVHACASSGQYDESLKIIQDHIRQRKCTSDSFLLLVDQSGIFLSDTNRKDAFEWPTLLDTQWREIVHINKRTVRLGVANMH